MVPTQEAEAALEQVGDAVDRVTDDLRDRSAGAGSALLPAAGTLLLVGGLAAAGVAVWLTVSRRRRSETDGGQDQPVSAGAQHHQAGTAVVRALGKVLPGAVSQLTATKHRGAPQSCHTCGTHTGQTLNHNEDSHARVDGEDHTGRA